MLSSRHKLLFITCKCMHLIGRAFYESDLDLNNRLESMWSLDIFGDMMATNNTVMQKDGVFRQIASTHHIEWQL